MISLEREFEPCEIVCQKDLSIEFVRSRKPCYPKPLRAQARS